MREAVVRRGDLLSALLSTRLVLVAAPGGSGKSTLAEQLLEEWDGVTVRVRVGPGADLEGFAGQLARGLRRAGLGDDADVIANSTPIDALDRLIVVLDRRADSVNLFIDDLHHLADDAADALCEVLADLPATSRAVLCGRDLTRFDPLASRAQRVRLDELQLSADETAVLLGVNVDATLVEEVLAATDGWPAAIALAAVRLRDDPTWAPAAAGGMKVLVRTIVDEIVKGDPSVLQLARLPIFDDETLALVGVRGRAPDLPARTIGRWRVLPSSIRELLVDAPALTSSVAIEIATHYRDCGEIAAAVELVGRECAPAVVLDYVAALRWTELADLDVAELRRLVEDLGGTATDRYAEVLVAGARAVELSDRTLRAKWLTRAKELAGDDGAIDRAVDVERARDVLRAADVDAGAAIAEKVLEHAGGDELVTRGRALVTVGMKAAFECTAESLAHAARTFTEAAALFRQAGETRWHAETLARLGYTALYMAGHPMEGQAAMAEALALLPVGDRVRAFWLTNYADVLDFLGRDVEADAAVREALEIGVRRHDDTTVGMAWWTRSWLAAHRNDGAALRYALSEVERHRGEWMKDGQLAEYLGSSAEHLALVGDLVGYHDFVERADEVATRLGFPEVVDTPRAWYESQHGDPQRGLELLARLETARSVVPSHRPRRLLLTAVAQSRLGNQEKARETADAAFASAAEMGVPDLHHRMHRPLLDLLTLDVDVDEVEHPIAILQLLGGFSLVVDGVDRTPQPGHPATLVKLLALRSTLTVEAAIDELWPDSDVATGRSRLRNLLNRLKDRAGPIVVRDGETLRLDESATVDATAFEHAAAAALSAPDDERVGRARLGLAMYTGELLPGDLYEDWATLARARLQRRFVSLADIVAEDSTLRGDLDEAARLLDLGIAAEPLDEARSLQLCELLATQGRRSMAREVARRCIKVMATIDVEASAELVDYAR